MLRLLVSYDSFTYLDDPCRDDTEPVEHGAPAMGAKSLCIPLEQPARVEDSDRCIHPDCSRKPQFYTLFGRSYWLKIHQKPVMCLLQ